MPDPVAVPASSSVTAHLPHLPTAATRSGRFFRHRRRSHRSPSVAGLMIAGAVVKDLIK